MLPTLTPLLQRFAERSPIATMARASLEHCLTAGFLDSWFDRTSETQYTRKLLFSTVFELMSQVVFRHQSSIHLAHQASAQEIGVTVQAVYGKLKGLEPGVSRALVGHVASQAGALIDELGAQKPLLAGYQLAGSEFLGASAGVIALINLFNLLPIFPLDGGRVLRALFASAGRGAMLIAMTVSVALTGLGLFALGIPLLAVLLGIGAMELYGEFRHGQGTGQPMSKSTIVAALLGYFLLAGLLAGAIFATGTTSGGALALEILRG